MGEVTEESVRWLNGLGDDGWELFQVVNYDNRELIYFFRKPLTKKTSDE